MGLTRPNPDAGWWNDPDTVWSVADHGVFIGSLPEARDVLYFFEKPWNYSALHADWEASNA